MKNLTTPFDIAEHINVNDKTNDAVKSILTSSHLLTPEEIELIDNHKSIIQSLYDLVEKHLGIYTAKFIATGRFGRLFNNWIHTYGWDFDVAYLTDDQEPLDLFAEGIKDHDFIVIDLINNPDLMQIKERVKALGGRYTGTFVIYDTNPKDHHEVHSIFQRNV